MEITFRRLTVADKPHVLEISAGVWGGEDYIPAVINAWLAAAGCRSHRRLCG